MIVPFFIATTLLFVHVIASDISIAWAVTSYSDVAATAGQTVTFSWSGNHNVHLLPDQAAFDACNFVESVEVASNAENSHVYTISENAAGSTLFFGCQVGSHCSFGQKVAVVVAALETSSPTPLPSLAPIAALTPRPTLQPTPSPTLSPSSQPAPLPTPHPPTPFPSLPPSSSSPTEDDNNGNVTTTTTTTTSSSSSGLSPLTCAELGWSNAAQFGSELVCSASDWAGGPGCGQSVAWSAASDACASAGARLCSAPELRADETRGSGCGLDDQLVWSSTPCEEDGDDDVDDDDGGGGGGVGGGQGSGFEVVHGSQSNADGVTRCSNTTTTTADDTPAAAHYFRCCADVYSATGALSRSPSLAPSPSPTLNPTALSERLYPLSVSSCDDLGWDNADAFGSSDVCGESEIVPRECPGFKTFDAARTLCLSVGARLCSAQELRDDETRGSGCGVDNDLIWSSTPCDDSDDDDASGSGDDDGGGDDGGGLWYELAYGASSNALEEGNGTLTTHCAQTSERNMVRCCADTLLVLSASDDDGDEGLANATAAPTMTTTTATAEATTSAPSLQPSASPSTSSSELGGSATASPTLLLTLQPSQTVDSSSSPPPSSSSSQSSSSSSSPSLEPTAAPPTTTLVPTRAIDSRSDLTTPSPSPTSSSPSLRGQTLAPSVPAPPSSSNDDDDDDTDDRILLGGVVAAAGFMALVGGYFLCSVRKMRECVLA